MKINLVYLSPWNIGGFASFTAHMYHALKAEGWDVQVLRCNKDREERNTRVMKHHETVYRNVTVAQAVRAAKQDLTLITAVARPDDLADTRTIAKLMRAGAYVFVQSTQEFKQFPHVEKLRASADHSQVMVIRESLKRHFTRSAKYIPHPYVRSGADTVKKSEWLARWSACSIAMIATNKHPRILCDANELLPKKQRIKFLGKETTHFLRKALMDKYANYEPGRGFVGSTQAVGLAKAFKINVDLSDYDGDGGGTQYSFLEAMDAGCINILHSNWLKLAGDMHIGHNCLAVENALDLSAVIHGIKWNDYLLMRDAMGKTLDDHSPKAISRILRRLA